ncbi:MAG: hypothetical protein JW818_03465 [Pirellulales bacterium]|nr:hypothetical protein [Pirellulales bacterium]
MSSPLDTFAASPSIETHLLGQIDFDQCLALQQRLVEEVAARDDGQVRLLLCEHPPLVTIGRSGSPADLRLDAEPLRTGRLQRRWVKRGGGCLVHAPGQLAVYPIVPLWWHELLPGEYLDRLQAALVAALDELGFTCEIRPGEHALWGRTGRLVSFGIAVRDGVTYHGAFINVSINPGLLRLVDPDADPETRSSTLTAERRGRAKMPALRAALVRHLADALGCDRYHLHTGPPHLRIRP